MTHLTVNRLLKPVYRFCKSSFVSVSFLSNLPCSTTPPHMPYEFVFIPYSRHCFLTEQVLQSRFATLKLNTSSALSPRFGNHHLVGCRWQFPYSIHFVSDICIAEPVDDYSHNFVGNFVGDVDGHGIDFVFNDLRDAHCVMDVADSICN